MNPQSFWYNDSPNILNIMLTEKGNSRPSEFQKETFQQKTFEKNDYIYFPNDPSDRIYFVRKGRIKIGTFSDSGKEITKTIVTAGEVFGELALIGQNTRADFAEAMEDTTVFVLTSIEMKKLMTKHSNLSFFYDANFRGTSNGYGKSVGSFGF